MIWLWSILSVVAVSLVSLLGLATLSLTEIRVEQLASILISFAVGALLGDAFIHLIPETFGRGGGLQASLLVLSGMMIFFVVEKLLRHRHGPLTRHAHPEAGGIPTLAAINLIGDGVHNFIDGVLIGASWMVGPTLGAATTVAVLFHEIPQELSDFGILVHSGLSVRRAVLLNLASASVAVVGTVTALVAGSMASAVAYLVPMTAGGFVYIAAANLIPELQHDHTLRGLVVQASLITLGVAVMGALKLLG